MDYTKQNIFFKLKKTIRYIRLYGLSRTIVKIKGQYHMKRQFNILPSKSTDGNNGHVGIMGCGNFAFSNIAYYLYNSFGKVIRGVMDADIHRAASLSKEYRCGYYTDQADDIINDPSINLVYIASNHASHAEYAIRALEVGKNVHIEKPHAVSLDQLKRLCQAMMRSQGKVALGFNRPKSRIGLEIKKHLNTQSGTIMLNWFVAGHDIAPEHWYFKGEEGGRVLGNLCHWTDFVYQMMPSECRYPLTIIPTRSNQSDCNIAVSYIFGDGSIAVITFSAKGPTFEGVREVLSAHRGNILISMIDFKSLTVENVEKKNVISPLFRDHGHEANIQSSYEITKNVNNSCSISYVWEAGELFLKTKDALEQNATMVLHSFSESCLR